VSAFLATNSRSSSIVLCYDLYISWLIYSECKKKNE